MEQRLAQQRCSASLNNVVKISLHVSVSSIGRLQATCVFWGRALPNMCFILVTENVPLILDFALILMGGKVSLIRRVSSDDLST